MVKDTQFVAALSHGLELLRCFSSEQPVLTNGQLSRMTGMPRSSVSRLTHTLVKVGYLDYESQSRAYRLGLSVLSLLPPALAGSRVAEDIAPHMAELADRIGVRVLLTAYEGYGLTVLQRACTNPDIPAPSLVGYRYRIPRRAMGRVCMASSSPDERERMLAHLSRDEVASGDALRHELDQAVDSYRAQGYCLSLGDGRPGNHSISVSVNVPHLGRRLFLACGGPAERLPERVLHDRVAPALMRAAEGIERTSARRMHA